MMHSQTKIKFRNGVRLQILVCCLQQPTAPALRYTLICSTDEVITDRVTPKRLKNVPQCHTLSAKNPIWLTLRLNPGLRG